MKVLLICTAACLALACGNAAQPVSQTPTNAPVTAKNEKPQTAIAHSSENLAAKPGGTPGERSKWTQSGDAIDTAALDAAVAAAEKALGAKPADAAAKKALGTAYFKRAVALTDARQYASALGDYRKTKKYDPANAEAEEWIERIISIYSSINRESPKEGEEPPPLPFKKAQ
jgi:tetratricopeptide (TPR) repeat protein